MNKNRAIALAASLLLFLSAAEADTVELVMLSSVGNLPRAIATELETGAMDLLYSEGQIVTSGGSETGSPPKDLPALLASAAEGRADWLLVLEPRWAGLPPSGTPRSLLWTIYSVGGSFPPSSGEYLLPAATEPGFADPVKRLRTAGMAAAAAILSILRPPSPLSQGGGGLLGPKGG